MLVFSYSVEFAIFFGVVFMLLYLHFIRNFNHWKNKNVPYIKPLPFVGNVLSGIMMRQCMGEIFYDMYYKTTKPLIGFFILDEPCLLLRDPKLIKKVLINDFQYFYDRTSVNNKRDDPIGTHILFMLKNPDWKEIRAKMTPVFTTSKMKNMSKLMEQSGNELVDYLCKTIKNDPVVETKELCARFTVDVITSTVFGINSNCFKDDNAQFRIVAKKLLDWDNLWLSLQMRCYFLAPKLVNLFRMKLLDPKCTNFLKNSFLEIMNKRDTSKNTRNDLIDILLQMKNNDKKFMEGDKLVSQAVMFFTAGFETSSSTMTFFLYEIACNPNIQNKLRKEINEIAEKYGGINYDSVKEMTYLDMCVKETLRKYSILPFLDRRCNSDYKFSETGVTIDKGTPIFISTLALQYDPEYFPNPEIFNPQRFSKTNDQIENFTYLPFGEGPRNCIGERFAMLSTKLGLATALKYFTVDICEETQKKIKFEPKGLVLSPMNGLKLKFQKIEETTSH